MLGLAGESVVGVGVAALLAGRQDATTNRYESKMGYRESQHPRAKAGARMP